MLIFSGMAPLIFTRMASYATIFLHFNVELNSPSFSYCKHGCNNMDTHVYLKLRCSVGSTFIKGVALSHKEIFLKNVVAIFCFPLQIFWFMLLPKVESNFATV